MKGIFTAVLATSAALANAKRHAAKFDDITIAQGVAVKQAIGNYEGLSWNNFDVLEIDNTAVGLQARSAPNVAGQSALTGSASLTPDTSPKVNNRKFTLDSFWFGCMAAVPATGNLVGGLPTSCTLTLTAFRKNKQVLKMDIKYNADDLAEADMMYVDLDSYDYQGVADFIGVDKVEFSPKVVPEVLGLGISTPINALYDDFRFSTTAA